MEQLTAKLIHHIDSHEDWLMERILDYAKKRDYTKYTSTLKEPWRLSISGLSKSLIELLKIKNFDIELSPDEDYRSDPATEFGIIEAKKHRERGIRLDMFLGLMKYYHQSYQDLIKDSDFSQFQKKKCSNFINRFFDRIEIAFCTNWAYSEKDQQLTELQARNRQMTNEKNKFLTIYESLSMPVFVVNPDGIIEDMNHAANQISNINSVPGSKYYKENIEKIIFTEKFPWLADVYANFIGSEKQKVVKEKFVDIQEKYFRISLSHSLDISGKFSGTIIIIEDITFRKKAEKEKEKYIDELQTALAEIKTLKGIIPICMHCKGIRDDKGAWNRLEKYISEHSEAQFSHGICEKCLKEHYPYAGN